ncbi:hypothetical protein NGRA_2058 [Nosema granulosis]|uniref:Uncharacterized protein n=1 Tax=Nosema granulosis TaxID=83296 RepID=A0A9P6GY91_9MICR|nr:hypothetical protein NGRA_2058 [Nosema granulosis]
MSLKKILIVAAIIIVILIIVGGVMGYKLWKKALDIDASLKDAKTNITPELKTMYGLTDEQCDQVYAGIFILAAIPEEDLRKIMNLDDSKIKKIDGERLSIRFDLFLVGKEQINKKFAPGTIPKKIVDLVKTPSDTLVFNEDYRSLADRIYSSFKTKETLLKKKIEGGKNYDIVETIIAALPDLLSSII